MGFGFLTIIRAWFVRKQIADQAVHLLDVIARNWKFISVTLLIVLFVHQNFMDRELFKWMGVRTISGLKQEYEQELSQYKEMLIGCEASRNELQRQIESVNQQIDQWANLSTQLQEQHDDLVDQLNDMEDKANKRVNDILEGPTPEDCEGSIQFLRDAARGELKWAN